MRRRLVWIQAQAGGLFLLYSGPDGHYVQKVGGPLQLAAPYSDAENPNGIFRIGLTAMGGNDWRFSAIGIRANYNGSNLLFYGPSGLLSSTTNLLSTGAQGPTGVFTRTTVSVSAWTVRQAFWYDYTGASGNGPNTYPDLPPTFVLPSVSVPNPEGLYFQNPTLTWAVLFNNAIDSSGNNYPITSGSPSPWIGSSTYGPGGKEGRVGNLVDLTLFVHDVTPAPDIITTTPYRYNPEAGTATAETSFVTPYTHPGDDYLLRHVSYWTATP